ncbi:MFS transporter [Sciscionella marina]|uniref:MFS transporter n=1 Tax=Sciscionella marina TaxID=508770 RepID=UPI00036FF5DC|nr:MFS transporter [Sciscionella marina]
MSASPKPSRILLVVTCGVIVYFLLESMLAPALPDIQAGVGGTPASVAWVFTGLLLSSAVTTPLVSRLADVADKRKVLLGVLAVVAAGVALAGSATSVLPLAIGQILQGAGLCLAPLATGIVRDVQPPHLVRRGNGIIIGSVTFTTGLGPALAGPIVTAVGYRWLFWGALLLLVVICLATARVVPPMRPPRRGVVDWSGAALLAGGLLVLLIGVTEAPVWGWLSSGLLGSMAGSLVLLAAFVLVELRVEQPLVDLRLGRRVLGLTALLSFVVGFATTLAYVCIPNLVAAPGSSGYGLGGTAATAGLLLVPFGLAGAVAAAVTGPLDRLLGPRLVIVLGNVLTLGSCATLLAAASSAAVVAIAAGLLGIGIGLVFTELINVVTGSVPAERASSVAGLPFVLRSVGGTLGSQISGSVLASEVIPGAGVPSWNAFTTMFWVTLAVVAAAVVLGVVLPARSRNSPALESESTPDSAIAHPMQKGNRKWDR